MLLGFVFPGQGSQSVGMLRELAMYYPTVLSTFEHASSILGYDLWKLVQEGPPEILNMTDKTQPALLTASVAIWRIWEELTNGIQPKLMAGHSLGEYSALVCSGAIVFEDAVALVEARGKYMQQAVSEGSGTMAAILGLEDSVLQEVCGQAAQDQVVAIANFNSIGQTVIAGHNEAVERAVAAARAAGAKKAIKLAVSVPSHCALMKQAAENIAEYLQRIAINPPLIPLIHNFDVLAKADSIGIQEALTQQLCQPVQWVKTIQKMAENNIDIIVECGPGKILTNLVKRIDRNIKTLPMFDNDSLHQALAEACG